MPTKFGRIVAWERTGAKFSQARLEGGERVDVPLDLRSVIERKYGPESSLVFVERRGKLFRYVHWAGTADEAVAAADAGLLRPNEIPWDIRMIGEELGRIRERERTRQAERRELALARLRELLGRDAPSIPLLARLIDASLRLTEPDLRPIRAEFARILDTGEFTAGFTSLSDAAINAGYAVRWVRWPGPPEPDDQQLYRMQMDDAARAIEVAAAALSEPTLDRRWFDVLRRPLAGLISERPQPQRPAVPAALRG